MAAEVTGTLKEACKVPGVEGSYLAGYVYKDNLGRFGDGDFIHTGLIRGEVEPGVFMMRSGTRYRVKSWAKDQVA